METKETLRKMIRERRGQSAPSDISHDSDIIFRRIREMDEYIISGAVYCYVDMKNEVQTRKFIAQALTDGKMAACPRVNLKKKEMDFYYIDSLKDLEEGTMGILEPKQSCERADSASALLIMPGVAFDGQLNRVGYGGGYYDRYVKANPWHKTVAVAFEFQMFDEVPHDENDVRPQLLITESRIYQKPRKPVFYASL
jgi:5-formyltetrahydrofolate cyclo-ligase